MNYNIEPSLEEMLAWYFAVLLYMNLIIPQYSTAIAYTIYVFMIYLFHWNISKVLKLVIGFVTISIWIVAYLKI